jgi:hypothetical protein
MPVTFDLSVLEPGDIVLSTQSGRVSRLIRWATKSSYSHAMLYIDRALVHAVSEGVWTINPERMCFEQHEVDVYRLAGLTQLQAQDICVAARAKVGSRYTTWEASLSVLLRLLRLKALGQSQYCSRLVAQAYNSQGIRLHSNPDHCFPSDLVMSAGWTIVLNGTRTWTSKDQYICDMAPDTLALEGKHVFAWLRALDWLSFLTFHGRIRDAEHAWNAVKKSRFLDLFSARFLKKSGWLGDAGMDEIVNPRRYNFILFHSDLAQVTLIERIHFPDQEWNVAFEMSGRIIHNLQYYASLGAAKTLVLIKDYEYARLKMMIVRLGVLAKIIASGNVAPPNHPAHTVVIAHLAKMNSVYLSRPF